ncbi:MAG TPA: 3D-(3,5/4)-trihydroxycyclohexane-1,2-dione acylhydrolase (decyclizing) [Candidatus Limnocylindrales bacterium]|nr:3D-(3,5/4)-trihydroxycyclohexane-1,2-dione acylhydrolase (decyclizing) [Candidatus Limnocylindrales bacterium]
MSGTRRLTVAQATIAFLAQQFVERDGRERPFFGGVFGIFGHGNVAGLGEALETAPHGLRYYQCRNEQAMVHVAAGYAKRLNRLGTFACTTSIGPGATNLVTGAAAATVNRLPVLLLPGDLFATRKVAPVLQQLERSDSLDASVNDTLRPVSRYWDRIERPEQLVAALPEAMRVLTSPAETGAVTIALPQDVQAEAFDFPEALFRRRVWPVARPRPDARLLDRAVDWIAASERPLLIAGGGVLYAEASEALARFVERTGIPVAETQAGKSALPWDHPANVGPVGVNGSLAANRLAARADLVLAVGTRLADFTTASKTAFQDPAVRFIGLNVVEMDAAKQAALPLVGDAREGLAELGARVEERSWRVGDGYARQVAELREAWHAEVDRVSALPGGGGLLSQAEVIATVNRAARPGDVVVCAAGSLPGDLLKLWRASRPGDYHVEYGYSTMGYEIAGGLGVKLASPQSEVFVMVGDGSWLMLSGEIVTAIQEGIRLTVVLVDNHGFGSIHGLAESVGERNEFNRFRYRNPATGRLDGPVLALDLAANAASLGARVACPRDRAGLEVALEEARRADRTTVVVVEVDPSVRVPSYESWWDVPVAAVSESPTVRAAREEYERRRELERWFL